MWIDKNGSRGRDRQFPIVLDLQFLFLVSSKYLHLPLNPTDATIKLSPQSKVRESQVPTTPLQRDLENEREKSFNQSQTTTNYQDFQIMVDKNNNIRASSDAGGEVSGQLRLNMRIIKPILNLIKREEIDKELLEDLGNELYQALFPNQINARFHATMANIQGNEYSARPLTLNI